MAYKQTKQYEAPTGGFRTTESIAGLFKMASINVAEVDLAGLNGKSPEEVFADSQQFRAQRQTSVDQLAAHSHDRRV
jgi:hypothetical protein